MNLTQHAEQRMQQRGIPRQAVDYVLAYGRVSHDPRVARVFWLDKCSKARLGQEEGWQVVHKLDKHLDVYAVIAPDGAVLTVGHR